MGAATWGVTCLFFPNRLLNLSHKKYKNLIYVFLGVLKRGQPWLESGYESPEDAVIKQMISLKKKQKEKEKKLLNELSIIDD